MSKSLAMVVPYIPVALLRDVRARPHLPTEPTAIWFPAAALFADVSGFTPLTEALVRQGPEGPEELTALLDRYFGRMVALIEAHGGDVVKFGGDAVTVLFQASEGAVGEAARRALQAAEAMQAAMADFETLPTSVGPISLGMKVGIGAGEVQAMQVGGVADRWEYVVAGDPLRQMVDAEGEADRGQIVLSPEAQALLHPHPLPPQPLERPAWTSVEDPALLAELFQAYVPRPIGSWMAGGAARWLAVLRPMQVLFFRVTGLPGPGPELTSELHAFLRLAQESIYRQEGVLSRIAIGDKGTVLLVLFGAPPYAHRDDAQRAVRCALELQRRVQERSSLELAIGITTGHLFAGPVGSDLRREYTVMGDSANLAARLMGKAGPGGILCDYDTYRQAHEEIAFETLLPIRVKGKAGPIWLYRPLAPATDAAPQPPVKEPQQPLVGRREELARLASILDAVEGGASRVLLIEGQAGIGKSRLVKELLRLGQERGLAALHGAGRSIEQQTPYRAWRDLFRAYFGLQEGSDPQQARRRVRDLVHDVAPEQLPRLPLLQEVLDLPFPPTEWTANLDPALRQQSLTALLLTLLRAWARERPPILILEDAQWLDSLSWELAVMAARVLTTAGQPLLLALVTRPIAPQSAAAQHLEILDALADLETLSLPPLAAEETVALATARLGLPKGTLPAPVAELVRRRAEGNPFLAEELVLALRDQRRIRIEIDPSWRDDRGAQRTARSERPLRCLVLDDLTPDDRTVPDTVQGLILDRIDRLPPERQLTLKMAAVIGQVFAYPTLRYLVQRHAEATSETLHDHLQTLSQLDLTPLLAQEPDPSYAFKNIITREVAYGTLLFAQRRALHRTVAEWYERMAGLEKGAAGIVPGEEELSAGRLYILAHHARQAGDIARERRYARLAGDRAAAQFANTEALRYYGRVLELTPQEEERYDVLLARERIYHVLGRREAQRKDLEALQRIAAAQGEEQQAEVALRWAGYAEATGDYLAAIAAAREAIDRAEQAGCPHLEAAGYLQWSRALQQKGHYEIAQVWLERGLERARAAVDRSAETGPSDERSGSPRWGPAAVQALEADCLRSLGMVADLLGAYDQAQTRYQEALDLYREVDDRRGEAAALNALGQVYHSQRESDRARAAYEGALQICRATGDRRGEGQALHHLGQLDAAEGDFEAAQAHYEQALQIEREIGDRAGEGATLRRAADLLRRQGSYSAAQDRYHEALQVSQAIDDRWNESRTLIGLGLAAHQQGNHAAARAHGEDALYIAQDTGDRPGRGRALTLLGHARLALGQVEEASAAYQRALSIHRDLGQEQQALAALAGLAQIALQEDDLPTALARVEEILATPAFKPGGALLSLLRTCSGVLQARDDLRAETLRQEAQRLAQGQTEGPTDPTTRRSFQERPAAGLQTQDLPPESEDPKPSQPPEANGGAL